MQDPPQDDFKWFGEGFDGFPKRLPEDVVEYIVFIIDSKLSDIQTRERLQAFQRALTSLEKKFLKEYIWQRESINLELIRDEGRWMLKGSTNYGDSVDDEWLIVYLLRELSKEFRDAWIRVYDTDGEFLLIEAANALPRWLNPEVAENRVWINDHRLHVIPMSQKETPRALQLKDALSIVERTPLKVKHVPKVEAEAFHRLKGYPAAISTNQHHAKLPLPRKVAYILHENPAYIAPAVEAFYLRDAIALRYLSPEKSKTPLVFPPEDFVNVSVRFTKILYAQLLGQNWVPPAPWEAAYETLIKANPSSSSPIPNFDEKASLGIKVSAGLEMLVQHNLHASKKSAREIRLLCDDLASGDEVLPSDAVIASTWSERQDDEGWLNIDFSEFEKELAGKGEKGVAEGTKGSSGGAGAAKAGGFGDKNAQENLRKMVERFNAFIDDEDAGLEGGKGLGLDPMDVDDDDDEVGRRGWEDPEDSDAEGEEEDSDEEDEEDDEIADAEFAEYEKYFEKFMTLGSAEKSALMDDARELACAEEEEQDEDEEIRKLSDMMQQELFSHGVLDHGPDSKSGKVYKNKLPATKDKGKGKAKMEDVPEENSDEENDSDDDGMLDDNYNLVDNMLKSFKGQGGVPGPAGNLMGLMGIQFPPDLDDDFQPQHRGSSSR